MDNTKTETEKLYYVVLPNNPYMFLASEDLHGFLHGLTFTKFMNGEDALTKDEAIEIAKKYNLSVLEVKIETVTTKTIIFGKDEE